ncbi:MAG: hypothetical protein V4439_02975 [Patescibacteria group bacterium]
MLDLVKSISGISGHRYFCLDVGGPRTEPLLLEVQAINYGRDEKRGMSYGGVVEFITQGVTVRKNYLYRPLNELMEILMDEPVVS